MRIGGFQKLTLLDYPGQMACIVFTSGCNLRCPFCHNAGLVLQGGGRAAETEKEILEYLNQRKNILDGIVVSGGEPLLQADLPDFLMKVKKLGYLVKLDTNGCFPERLRSLLDQKLIDYAAMDLKHVPEKYTMACGVDQEHVVPLIRESIRILKESEIPFEFRTTVVKGIHTEEDVVKIAEMIRGEQPYYLQSYVDSGCVISSEGLQSFSAEEMQHLLSDVKTYCPNAELRT